MYLYIIGDVIYFVNKKTQGISPKRDQPSFMNAKGMLSNEF